MELHLDTRETDLLMGVLERRLLDLRRELQHTDRQAFREALKADAAALDSLLEKLKPPAAIGM